MNPEVLVFLFAAFSFVMTVIWGGPLIKILGMLKIGDTIRLELRDRFIEKAGKPTMGGVMFIIPTILISVFVNAVALIGGRGTGRSILIVIGTMVVFGFLGALDDWEKLRQKEKGEGHEQPDEICHPGNPGADHWLWPVQGAGCSTDVSAGCIC